MKNSSLSNIVCSIFLGIAFVVGCTIVSGGSDLPSDQTIEKENLFKPLMSIQETADYLNISESQVRAIIGYEETILKTSGSYTGKMFPIIKIGNDIFVSSVGLNEWIVESSQQRMEY